VRAAAVAGVAFLLATAGAPRADEVVATYSAYWGGLPAGHIRLKVGNAGASYRYKIEISTDGVPRLVTHFRAEAEAVGRLSPGSLADPARYDALYDLRKRRNSRIAMRFVLRDGATVAERAADDTSRKPPLAEKYRRGTVDPLSALERIRTAIAHAPAPNTTFVVPVYDGTRRFDVLARILPKEQQTPGALRIELSLRPIAGFKGDSSEDGDPDDAPRPVALTLTDDARLLPVSITVRVFYLPLVVQLDQVCPGSTQCSK
jgi:Protein of unknown function (DUF3108)